MMIVPPAGVNLIALPTKFSSTSSTRSPSAWIGGNPGAKSLAKITDELAASPCCISIAAKIAVVASNWRFSTAKCPLSMALTSNRSSIKCSARCAARKIRSTERRAR